MLGDRVAVHSPAVCELVDRAEPGAVLTCQLIDIGGGEALQPSMVRRCCLASLGTYEPAAAERFEEPFNRGRRV